MTKTTAADLAAAKDAWRRRCIAAMGRFTGETKRLILKHSITIDLEDDEGAADSIAARAWVRDHVDQRTTRARLEGAERDPNSLAPHRLHAAKQLQDDMLVVIEAAWRLTD